MRPSREINRANSEIKSTIRELNRLSTEGGCRRQALARVALVVGCCRLCGKADEQGDGFAVGEANEQRAVAVDAVIVGKASAVALHHVDVVHAPFGSKAEGRIAA